MIFLMKTYLLYTHIHASIYLIFQLSRLYLIFEKDIFPELVTSTGLLRKRRMLAHTGREWVLPVKNVWGGCDFNVHDWLREEHAEPVLQPAVYAMIVHWAPYHNHQSHQSHVNYSAIMSRVLIVKSCLTPRSPVHILQAGVLHFTQKLNRVKKLQTERVTYVDTILQLPSQLIVKSKSHVKNR